MPPLSAPIAAGLDGCRGGWAVALALGPPENAVERTELTVVQRAGPWLDRLERSGRPPAVAIDMPMGLPARAGMRTCDRLARERLGPRRSSIFPALDRELLGLDFATARARVLERRESEGGVQPVMTHEAINLAPKIAELDALLRERPDRQRWISEAHPELSFLTLARSLRADAGPLPSKRGADGRAARTELLGAVFPDCGERLAAAPWRRSAVGADDLLDAYAMLWTALRVRAGTAERLGGERDQHGLVMQMVC